MSNRTLEEYQSLDRLGYVYNNKKDGRFTLYEILVKDVGINPEILDFKPIHVPEGLLLRTITINRKAHYIDLCKDIAIQYTKLTNGTLPYKVKSATSEEKIMKGRSSVGNVYHTKDVVPMIKSYLEKYPIEIWDFKKTSKTSVPSKERCEICEKDYVNLPRHLKTKSHKSKEQS